MWPCLSWLVRSFFAGGTFGANHSCEIDSADMMARCNEEFWLRVWLQLKEVGGVAVDGRFFCSRCSATVHCSASMITCVY
jgi:hypothetical protein